MKTDGTESRQVLDLLDRVRREWQAARILGGLAVFLSAGLGSALAFVLGAMWFPMSVGLRWGIRTAWLAWLVVSVVLFVCKRVLQSPADEEVAVLVEDAHPELHNEIINVVRLARKPSARGGAFVRAAIRESGRTASSLGTRGVVSWRRCGRRAAVAVVLLFGWAALLSSYPARSTNAVARLAFPRANLPKVGNIRIVQVTPGDTTVVAGENLAVEAVVEGTSRGKQAVQVQHFVRGGAVNEETMQPSSGNRFVCVLLDIKAPRTYRVAAGDSRSRDFQINVTVRPMVKRISAAYRYPAYTRLEPSGTEDCGGVLRAVKGSRAMVTITANKRLRSATLDLGSDPLLPLALEPGRTTAVTRRALEITASVSGKIEIEDEFGCRNSRPLQVIAVPDQPPRATVSAPGTDRVLAVGESLQLALQGNDDYGIVRAELVERRTDPASGKPREPRVVKSWNSFSNPRNVAIHWKWTFEKKTYKNGEIVRYFVRMVDGNDVGKPGVGTSAEFLVRLEDLAARQKQRDQKYSNWQGELEKVLKEQKELRQSAEKLGRGSKP